jgi:cell division protein FtsB
MAVIVSLYFAVRTSHAVVADRALAAQLQDAQLAVDTFKQQNGDLSTQLAYQRTPAYAEQVAREQLGLMKPGDHVVHVQVAAPAQGVPAAPTPTPIAAPHGRPAGVGAASSPNWKRWLLLFTRPAAFDAAPSGHPKA